MSSPHQRQCTNTQHTRSPLVFGSPSRGCFRCRSSKQPPYFLRGGVFLAPTIASRRRLASKHEPTSVVCMGEGYYCQSTYMVEAVGCGRVKSQASENRPWRGARGPRRTATIASVASMSLFLHTYTQCPMDGATDKPFEPSTCS